MEAKNPYYLKDNDGGCYNKYPEFQIWEEGFKAGEQRGVKKVVGQVNLLARSLIAGQDIATVAGNELTGDTSYLLLPLLEWQAQIKAWGINCP